jgi:hypothetical protein
MLYHLTTAVTPAMLREAGYDWLAGRGLVRCQTAGGPAGVGGTVLGDAKLVTADRCRWQPTGQRWRTTALDGLHVGLWDDLPAPGPGDLARAKQLQGHQVELLDGREWLAPIARGWTEEDGDLRWYTALPQQLDHGPDGWRKGAVLPRYASLWKIAERWEANYAAAIAAAVAMHQADYGDAPDVDAAGELLAVEISLSDAADMACQCLAANYRVTAAEISLLGLFADATPAAVLDALIDRPTRIAWAKKNVQPDPDSPNSSDGNGASTPATGQP